MLSAQRKLNIFKENQQLIERGNRTKSFKTQSGKITLPNGQTFVINTRITNVSDRPPNYLTLARSKVGLLGEEQCTTFTKIVQNFPKTSQSFTTTNFTQL